MTLRVPGSQVHGEHARVAGWIWEDFSPLLYASHFGVFKLAKVPTMSISLSK